MSDRSQSVLSERSVHSSLQTRSFTPDYSVLSRSEVTSPRKNITDSTLNILRGQVNVLFEEVENTNKRIDDLADNLNQLKSDISRDLKIQSSDILANMNDLFQRFVEQISTQNMGKKQETLVKTVVPPSSSHLNTNADVSDRSCNQNYQTNSDSICAPVYTCTSNMSTPSRSFIPIQNYQGGTSEQMSKTTILAPEPKLPEFRSTNQVKDSSPVNIGYTKPHEYDGKTKRPYRSN